MIFGKHAQLSGPIDEFEDERRAIEAVRESLSGDSNVHYLDVRGDGTYYRCSGVRFGVGHSYCEICIFPNGMTIVKVTSVPVPESCMSDVKRLCRIWNKDFVLRGLCVKDGRLVFETEPYDRVAAGMTCSHQVHLAFVTIRSVVSALLALEAGVGPWDLVDLGD